MNRVAKIVFLLLWFGAIVLVWSPAGRAEDGEVQGRIELDDFDLSQFKDGKWPLVFFHFQAKSGEQNAAILYDYGGGCWGTDCEGCWAADCVGGKPMAPPPPPPFDIDKRLTRGLVTVVGKDKSTLEVSHTAQFIVLRGSPDKAPGGAAKAQFKPVTGKQDRQVQGKAGTVTMVFISTRYGVGANKWSDVPKGTKLKAPTELTLIEPNLSATQFKVAQ
jgi:hypothetical protein